MNIAHRNTKFSRIEGDFHHPLAKATPPQGAGNSDDLRTPVNAIQGAREFLVNDDYQFEFDDFLGPRPSGSTNSDAAQQDSSTGFTSAAFGSSPLEARRTPVTVGQDADRLITELDRDRAVKLELFRAMCAAFDQAAAGCAAGPGHILAQEFKQHYLRFWIPPRRGRLQACRENDNLCLCRLST
ncbi:hypothetical protein E4U15_000408 [Claviceps sp. LM218 group G6]|nr:hypothetical protein E4U15_000408 [Claviceps sp. LM218 group G6]